MDADRIFSRLIVSPVNAQAMDLGLKTRLFLKDARLAWSRTAIIVRWINYYVRSMDVGLILSSNQTYARARSRMGFI